MTPWIDKAKARLNVSNEVERMKTGAARGEPLPAWAWPAARWQKCPVCLGCGTVPHDFYNQFGSSTSTAREQCRSCGGRGIIK